MQYSWSKRESNIRTQAFSMSFLRKDNPFSTIAVGYDSGFILYPHLKTPPAAPVNKLKVYCAFPLDAQTDFRGGRRACGQSQSDKTGISKPCHMQGITSEKSWIKHFEKVLNTQKEELDISYNTCGFDMTTKTAAKHFELVLAGNTYFQKHTNQLDFKGNELRVEAWSENCAEIPIEQG